MTQNNPDEPLQAFQTLLEFQEILAWALRLALTAPDESTYVQKLCELIIEQSRFRLACVARPDDHGEWEFLASAPYSARREKLRVQFTDHAQAMNSWQRVWREGQFYFGRDLKASRRLPETEPSQAHSPPALAALPLRQQGRPWGVLIL